MLNLFLDLYLKLYSWLFGNIAWKAVLRLYNYLRDVSRSWVGKEPGSENTPPAPSGLLSISPLPPADTNAPPTQPQLVIPTAPPEPSTMSPELDELINNEASLMDIVAPLFGNPAPAVLESGPDHDVPILFLPGALGGMIGSAIMLAIAHQNSHLDISILACVALPMSAGFSIFAGGFFGRLAEEQFARLGERMATAAAVATAAGTGAVLGLGTTLFMMAAS